MSKQEVFDKVVAIIGPFAKDEEALKGATEETNILTDLKVNSARLVDIILDFEDQFDIAIDDDAADQIQTLGDAVNKILEIKG
ncbi:phosphopantetheine-binding protein [Spirochaeta africana]|uniref:Acyl carrier protein n=1 Tax=Spirochaeta africana (strain ATCC 700263 / DSM 8902 / Z-7692) TaxID=889378 RepID=H9ULC7_SPIAZ|nr:phosphopantetheine-binding protein [Spirochaeta africana]AFG38320.1 acyl carrier protein [Spirochaeta africana DSM 8902]